jgi:IS4 transposase
VRSFGDSVQVKLIFVRRKTKGGLKTHVFVSDIAFKPKVASELYRCRWRIETNNREVEKFRARTTSRSMKLRRIYYSLAALLYNLWIVVRSRLGRLRSYEFKNILSIQSSAASPPVTFECSLGPPP